MFTHIYIRQKKLVFTLLAMLLVSAFLFAPSSIPPAAQAQSSADLSLKFFGPSYARAGEYVTYELEVENLSSTTYSSVVIYNWVPTANLTYFSGGTLKTDTGTGNNYVEFMLTNLAPNTKQTVSWFGLVPSSTPVGSVISTNGYGFLSSSPGAATIASGGATSALVEAAPTGVVLYKNANGTAFDVKEHGYQFQNYGASPTNADDFTSTDVYELVGPAACIEGTGATKESCVLKASAQAWLENTAIPGPNGGHCDGFAATSLRLFNSLPYNQFSTPGTFQSGATNTIDLVHPEQNVEHYIHRYFMTQYLYTPDDYITGTPIELLSILIDDFSSATPAGYTVSIWVTDNLNSFNGKWSLGHSITVIGVEQVTTTDYRILVYDNNFPKQRQYITVDAATNSWRYQTSATPGTEESVYIGNDITKNMRIYPLSSRDKPAGQYFPCTFCNSSTSSSANVETEATPNTANSNGMMSGKFEINFLGEGDILIIDDEGHKLGYAPHTGESFSEIPIEETRHFVGGLDKEYPAAYIIPYTETDDTFYTVQVHGTTVDDPTNGTLSIHGPGFNIGVSDIQLDPDDVFEFTFSPDGDHISFTATEDVEAPEIYIAHDPIHAGNPSVIFDVEGIELLAGEKVMLDLDPELERIHFDHTGPEAENFDIDMRLIWPDGDVQDWDEMIHMPAGTESAFVDFGAWDGLVHPPIYIDDVLQNPEANHRLKLENAVGSYDPTPQTGAPAGVYNIEATFSNVTEVSLEDVYFTVANLGAGDVLLNADSGTGGSRISVPTEVLGADGILHTFDSFTYTFQVGLADTNFADLILDANGVPHDWIHPDPAPSYDANNASFVFDGAEALPNQLGLMEADVQALVSEGLITQRNADKLIRNLERAEQFIAQERLNPEAVNEMRKFMIQLDRFATAVPAEVKAPLLDQVDFVTDTLQQ